MPGTVGFIGLGAMGGPMAHNLVKHGFPLVVHDIDPAKVERLVSKGATKADSAEAVAAHVERTICMVETTVQAESVIAGDRGIVKGAKAGHIVVCMSTIDISFKDQELETAFAKQLGVPVLLANVTQQVYQMARAAGFNKEDGSAVLKIFERLAGITVGKGQ